MAATAAARTCRSPWTTRPCPWPRARATPAPPPAPAAARSWSRTGSPQTWRGVGGAKAAHWRSERGLRGLERSGHRARPEPAPPCRTHAAHQPQFMGTPWSMENGHTRLDSPLDRDAPVTSSTSVLQRGWAWAALRAHQSAAYCPSPPHCRQAHMAAAAAAPAAAAHLSYRKPSSCSTLRTCSSVAR